MADFGEGVEEGSAFMHHKHGKWCICKVLPNEEQSIRVLTRDF